VDQKYKTTLLDWNSACNMSYLVVHASWLLLAFSKLKLCMVFNIFKVFKHYWLKNTF
jgi:hypothetical protein